MIRDIAKFDTAFLKPSISRASWLEAWRRAEIPGTAEEKAQAFNLRMPKPNLFCGGDAVLISKEGEILQDREGAANTCC
eukprot:symbB.v1.2.005047.t1/scaffold291.1/size238869/12